MIVAVALPGTPLLVPGVAGAEDVLGETRSIALGALEDLVRGAVRVVVLDCGAQRAGARRGSMRPDLAALGVESRWWGWGARDAHAPLPAAGVPASVALLALDAAGWTGPVEVIELGPESDAGQATRVVREVVASRGAALVVVTGAQVLLPDGDAHPGRAGAESAVVQLLGTLGGSPVVRATGEGAERAYHVVSFHVPDAAGVDTVPG